MNDIFKLVLSLSLSGGILAIMLFALRPVLRHRISKQVQYWIWIVVLLRLLLPVSFETNMINVLFNENNSIGSGSQSLKNTVSSVSENNVKSAAVNDLENTDAEGTSSAGNARTEVNTGKNVRILPGVMVRATGLFNAFAGYACYVWILGMAVALLINLTGYARFLKHLKKANIPAAAEESAMLSELLGGRMNIGLVRNRFSTTPMLTGFFRPVIIIPDIEYSREQLKNILLHEIVHLRHFDIAFKWLSVAAVSIHWFNPAAHMAAREFGRACELACDEVVIGNLDAAGRQSYGDTLISVAAGCKYPAGLLQATMCEEKESLKERLVAIMKHRKKTGIALAASAVLVAAVVTIALYLGSGTIVEDGKLPGVYVSAEGSRTKAAFTGTEASGEENVISVTGGQQLVISTQKIKMDKKYEFTMENYKISRDGEVYLISSQKLGAGIPRGSKSNRFYDADGKPLKQVLPDPDYTDGCLYLPAPVEKGEYIYYLDLTFKNKGTFPYGFVVRVDLPTYDLAEISKYRTPYVGNHSKDLAIAALMPVPDRYFTQRYISLKTDKRPYGLTIYYEAATAEEAYTGEWPVKAGNSVLEANSALNALVAFCMIDNVDWVTLAFWISKSDGKLEPSRYETSFTFQRSEFEKKYGDLALLGKDPDLLHSKLEQQ